MIPLLREWFSANHPLVIFVYGQAFFVMGLAIALQSRRYSRLDLARSLPWLAAFGLTHGLNEWGDLFIPVQSAFLADPMVHLLRAGQTILLAISFACLMQFGVELLLPLADRLRWLRFLPAILLILWLLGPFWGGLQFGGDLGQWHLSADALARYMLGFPGAMLAAFALRRHALLRIAPLGLPRIYGTLRLAGLALGAYAIVGGLIVPPALFFPASALNSQWVTDTLIIPPQVFRSIAGLVMAVAIIRALEVFEVETDRLIEKMEDAQVVAVERERIGRDLHDGALQRVYAAGLLAQSLRGKAEGGMAEGLDRLMNALNDAIAELRAFLFDLRPGDSPADLTAVLTATVDEARRTTGIEIRMSLASLPALPPDRLAHLSAFTREALSNAVRHAHARTVEVAAECADDHLRIIVRDDGRGMPVNPEAGFGLRNMRDRARLLGGEVALNSASGKGTTVTLTLPLERTP